MNLATKKKSLYLPANILPISTPQLYAEAVQSVRGCQLVQNRSWSSRHHLHTSIPTTYPRYFSSHMCLAGAVVVHSICIILVSPQYDNLIQSLGRCWWVTISISMSERRDSPNKNTIYKLIHRNGCDHSGYIIAVSAKKRTLNSRSCTRRGGRAARRHDNTPRSEDECTRGRQSNKHNIFI